MNLAWLFREPLALFLLLGSGLFALEVVRDGQAQRTIVVDEAALLGYIEHQTGRYDRAATESRLQAMSPADRNQLINDYIREEALHREALARGFDKEDYVIRRRLVQNVEFMAEAAAKEIEAPAEADLLAYFDANKHRYTRPPRLTFTHVYLRHAEAGAAEALLAELDRQSVKAAAAGRFGDRFAYFLNYVDRDQAFVASHFGEDMAAQLFAADAVDTWIGPFESPHGTHLVLVMKRTATEAPVFADMREKIELEYLAEQQRLARERYLADLVSEYRVESQLVR